MNTIIIQHSNFNRAPAEQVDCNTCRVILVDEDTHTFIEIFKDKDFSEKDWKQRMGDSKSWLNRHEYKPNKIT